MKSSFVTKIFSVKIHLFYIKNQLSNKKYIFVKNAAFSKKLYIYIYIYIYIHIYLHITSQKFRFHE